MSTGNRAANEWRVAPYSTVVLSQGDTQQYRYRTTLPPKIFFTTSKEYRRCSQVFQATNISKVFEDTKLCMGQLAFMKLAKKLEVLASELIF